jgi:hypothetical protein
MTDIVRDDFFKIGIGFLVLALRLGMVRYTLRRSGAVPLSRANELITSGAVITVIGLLVASMGVLRSASNNTEGIVLITAGAGIGMLFGIAWVLEGTVQAGRGTFRLVSRSAIVTAVIGVVLIALYFNAVY